LHSWNKNCRRKNFPIGKIQFSGGGGRGAIIFFLRVTTSLTASTAAMTRLVKSQRFDREFRIFTREKLKLARFSYYHSRTKTNLCSGSAVKVGLLSQVHVRTHAIRHQSVAALATLNIGSWTVVVLYQNNQSN